MQDTKFLELVKSRKSIRKYKDTPVERGKIMQCIEASRLAPSACNSQPWRFIVIDNPQTKEAFCNEVFSGVFKRTQFAAKAPVIVALISDKGNLLSKIGNVVRTTQFWLINIGIAVENFCLQAADIGLGTCMLGWFNQKAADRFLKIPKGQKTELLISLGYPDENPDFRPRKTIEKISEFYK